MYAEYIRWICAVLAIIVAALSIKSLLSKSETAKWAKKGLFCFYLSVIIWGLLLMLEISHFAMMTSTAYQMIHLFKNIISGMIIGMFFILFLSGELNLNKWKK
jgi:hypothetical protein